MTNLSVVVIAGNEESIILNCLTSASFADEIILVAANSTDKTKNIAISFSKKIKVITINDSYGKFFSKWRNAGTKACTCENILHLDADEQITASLEKEINKFCNQSEYTLAAIPRNNLYLGRKVKYGGSYPDYQKRLFKKDKFVAWRGDIHEEPEVKGKLLHFTSAMTHNTHRDLFSMTEKSLHWTDTLAKKLHESKHPKIASWRLLRIFFSKFCGRFFVQKMFLDKTVGLVSALHESFDTVIAYSKLWELQKKP